MVQRAVDSSFLQPAGDGVGVTICFHWIRCVGTFIDPYGIFFSQSASQDAHKHTDDGFAYLRSGGGDMRFHGYEVLVAGNPDGCLHIDQLFAALDQVSVAPEVLVALRTLDGNAPV